MKLQINTSGAWKNLIEFKDTTADALDSVLYHSRALLSHGAGRVSMRVTDDKNVPKLYLDGPGKTWSRANTSPEGN